MLASLVLAAAVFDPQTGAVQVDRGILSSPLQGDLPQAARAWALSRRGELGLPADSTLVNGESFGTRFGASFHLLQQLDGVEVYGANAVVTVDKSARVVLLTSSLTSYRQARKGWLIDGDEALRRAAREVPLPALEADGSPHGAARKAYFPVGEDVHAGWIVHVPTVDVRQNFYVAIDATTGAVLQRWNRVFNAALDANAYRLSPGGLDAGVAATPTQKVTLTHDDGGSMLSADAGGVLVGTQLDAYNCCVFKDCDPSPADAGPLRSSGTTMVAGFTINFDVVACDFQRLATNDPSKHDAGSFEYAPIDPPMSGPFQLLDPANSDEFSEVHGFYQVNKVYDWVRGLSRAATPLFPNNQPAIVPFRMRDERLNPARKPAIWSNVVFPDFSQINFAAVLMGQPVVLNSFGRLDNAAFLARENFAQIPLNEYKNDVDTMMIFQGPAADFGYDAPVLWHEFGHGVVYSTAGLALDRLALDSRSANNESGALHEGFADYIAGAFGGDPSLGAYVGPRAGAAGMNPGIRQEEFLRSLDNNLSCPDVLVGEVHDDSQHVSAALWRARNDHYRGADDGGTFDATFYAMLVSLSASADFAQVAQVMRTHVDIAFPDAGQPLSDVFAARGVTGCSKVIDMTPGTPRRSYGIGGRSQTTVTSGFIPGPVQMRVRTPNGAQSVTVTTQVGGGDLLSMFGGGQTRLKLLGRVGTPITFNRNGATLNNDATATVDLPTAMNSGQATVNLNAPCGASSEVYVTIANDGMSGVTLQNVNVSVQPPASCNPPMDAGTMTDAGTMNMTVKIPGIITDGGTEGVFAGGAVGGCGCGASGLGGPLMVLLLAVFRRRRRE